MFASAAAANVKTSSKSLQMDLQPLLLQEDEAGGKDCPFDSLLLVSLPLQGKPVPSENCTRGGIVPDGGGCAVLKPGYTCTPVGCLGGTFNKSTCAPNGCEFASLHFKSAESERRNAGASLNKDAAVGTGSMKSIAQIAELATRDAELSMNDLRLQMPPATEILIDPSAIPKGIAVTGDGCVNNGSLTSGWSCFTSKPGYDCTPLVCEAEKWIPAICKASGCFRDAMEEELIANGVHVLGGTNCTDLAGKVSHGSACTLRKDGFTCGSALCNTGKFSIPQCRSNGCNTSTINLPSGATISGENCEPGKKLVAGASCAVNLEGAVCTSVKCSNSSTSFSSTTCKPECSVHGTCCTEEDLRKKIGQANDTTVGIECVDGGSIVEVGMSCDITKEGHFCPKATCEEGGFFSTRRCQPNGCDVMKMHLPFGARASGAGCDVRGTVQHGSFCKVSLEQHACSAAVCRFGKWSAPFCWKEERAACALKSDKENNLSSKNSTTVCDPTTSKLKADAWNLFCSNQTCTVLDIPTCCEEKQAVSISEELKQVKKAYLKAHKEAQACNPSSGMHGGEGGYPWHLIQDDAEWKLFPAAKGSVEKVCGEMGAVSSFREGIRDTARIADTRLSEDSAMDKECKANLAKVASIPLFSGAGTKYAPSHGMTMLREEHTDFWGRPLLNLYTIKTGRLIQIATETGELRLLKDLCHLTFLTKYLEASFQSLVAVSAGAAWQMEHDSSHAEMYVLMNGRTGMSTGPVRYGSSCPGRPPQQTQLLVAVTKHGQSRAYKPSGLDMPHRFHNIGWADCGFTGSDPLSMSATTSHRASSAQSPAVHLFVAVSSNTWSYGAVKMSSMYDKTTIFSAQMPEECNCAEHNCLRESDYCQLRFHKLHHVVGGVISMVMHQSYLYMIKVAYTARLTGKQWRCSLTSNMFQDALNEVSVMPMSREEDGLWQMGTEAILAGGTMDVGHDGRKQRSTDGYGTNASFVFFHMRGPCLEGWDRFAGGDITIAPDVRTGKTYAIVVEGSAHKVRMLDVSQKASATTKVSTVGLMVGSQGITRGGTDDVHILSKYGVIQNLNLYPTIPCGNLWNFTQQANDAWNATNNGNSEKVFYLRRKSASISGQKQPWIINIMKKTINANKIVHGARLTKTIICSRPENDNTGVKNCCVRKNSESQKQLNKQERHKLQGALAML